jgi:hypothetical protein
MLVSLGYEDVKEQIFDLLTENAGLLGKEIKQVLT